MKNKYIVTAVLVIVFTGIGFYGGIQYQKGQRGNFSGQFGMGGQGTMRNGRLITGTARGGFRPVSGEILSSDDKSFTVKLQDNSSKIILISAKTVINKAQTVDQSELKVGEKVSIFGSENSDGSVTAQNIQLNPVQRMGAPSQ
jgi:hypothetical protein